MLHEDKARPKGEGSPMSYSAPRGTQDILPEDAPRWQALERAFRAVCARYGYGEIRTPVFEETDLFVRSVGAETDIVSKEMYTFTDRGGRSMTLRPEGTAPVVRAYLEHKLHGRPGVQKFYYVAPIFRYDRPQAGRYRQHHQVGIEALGAPGPDLDAEIIALATDLLTALDLQGGRLNINSIGCPDCRPAYREALRRALEPCLSELCALCQHRYQHNPLRILDDKNEQCRELTRDAPSILDYLCEPCREHFAGLRALLDELQIAYAVNPRVVRGLDYYVRTTFEIVHEGLGAQNALLGGGRYDGLAEELGGPPTPGIGFGSGIERLLLALQSQGWCAPAPAPPVYVATMGDAARRAGFLLLARLRRAGVAADMDYLARSLNAQMKEADRRCSPTAIVIGEDEIARGVVTLRDMTSREQREVTADEAVALLSRSQSETKP
jgi:histidyl-tRNA synthetase